MKKFTLCILLLTITGCSPMHWYKPGASNNDFSKDKYDCTQQAQQRVSSARVNAYGWDADNTVITNQNLFASCMNSKGWYLRRSEDAQKQQYTQTQKFQHFKDEEAKINNESRAMCGKEEYKSLFAKSACRAGDLSLDQLSDTTKILPAEKPVFMAMYSERKDRNKRLVSAYRAAGSPVGLRLAALLEKMELKAEKYALDMYEGKISWGDYNKHKKELTFSLKEGWNEITKGH